MGVEKKKKKKKDTREDAAEQERGRTQSFSSREPHLPHGFLGNTIGMMFPVMSMQPQIAQQFTQSVPERQEKHKKNKQNVSEKEERHKKKKKKRKRKRDSSSESWVPSPLPKRVRSSNFSEAPPPPPGPPPTNEEAAEREQRILELLAEQEKKEEKLAPKLILYLSSNNIALERVSEKLKTLTLEQQETLATQGRVSHFPDPVQVLLSRIRQLTDRRQIRQVDLIGPSIEEQVREMQDRDDFEAQMALKDARRERKKLALQNEPADQRPLSIAELLDLEDQARQQMTADPSATSDNVCA